MKVSKESLMESLIPQLRQGTWTLAMMTCHTPLRLQLHGLVCVMLLLTMYSAANLCWPRTNKH